jgi:hypothetical protein
MMLSGKIGLGQGLRIESGVLEYWSTGVLETIKSEGNPFLSQHANTIVLHHSIVDYAAQLHP